MDADACQMLANTILKYMHLGFLAIMIFLHLTYYNVELSFTPNTHKFSLQVQLIIHDAN